MAGTQARRRYLDFNGQKSTTLLGTGGYHLEPRVNDAFTLFRLCLYIIFQASNRSAFVSYILM